jgi:hypothetical protein
MTAEIAWFRGAFDADQAKKDKTIKPRAGVDTDYDATKQSIADIEQELEDHLQEVTLTYVTLKSVNVDSLLFA